MRRTRDLAIAEPQAALAWLEEQRPRLGEEARGLFSPLKIIECVQAAVQLPFDEGLARERALFIECLDSPNAPGLIHAFFAEREVAKVPEAQAAQPRPVASIAVIGGGTMGAGIAVAALDAGLPGDHDRARCRVHRPWPRQRGKGLQRPGGQRAA